MAASARYKYLLDNLPTSVLALDPMLVIRYLNPAAESLFETSLTRAQGCPSLWETKSSWGRNTLTRKIKELGLEHPEAEND